jgi:DDE superfamily endonuclease
VVLDGTLIPIDRVATDPTFYSGKHRRHGMNLQVIAAPNGDIVWASGPLPGAVHDLTAARI